MFTNRHRKFTYGEFTNPFCMVMCGFVLPGCCASGRHTHILSHIQTHTHAHIHTHTGAMNAGVSAEEAAAVAAKRKQANKDAVCKEVCDKFTGFIFLPSTSLGNHPISSCDVFLSCTSDSISKRIMLKRLHMLFIWHVCIIYVCKCIRVCLFVCVVCV